MISLERFADRPAVLKTGARKLRRLLPLSAERVVPANVVEISAYAKFPSGFHGTNPSVVKVRDGYLVCLRGVNYSIESLSTGARQPL